MIFIGDPERLLSVRNGRNDCSASTSFPAAHFPPIWDLKTSVAGRFNGMPVLSTRLRMTYASLGLSTSAAPRRKHATGCAACRCTFPSVPRPSCISISLGSTKHPWPVLGVQPRRTHRAGFEAVRLKFRPWNSEKRNRFGGSWKVGKSMANEWFLFSPARIRERFWPPD